MGYKKSLFWAIFSLVLFFGWSACAHAATLIKPANTLGLIGWWRFDEESGSIARDSSGQGNNGSLNEMDNTNWTMGVVGTALQFDGGTGEHVSVPHSASLSPTSAVTVLGWAKPITYGSGAATFVEKAYGTSYILYLESSLQGMIFNVNGIDCLSDSTIIALSAWQHIAATYDGTIVRFYVDGIEKGTCDNVGSVGTDSSDVKIGNDDTLTTAFDGHLDDVRIYNRALSRNEILQIVRGDRVAKAAVTPEAAGPLASDLAGWWTFDGRDVNWGSGRVIDKSGQDNHGMIINLGTTTTPTDGPLGQAFLFNGVNGYVSGTQSGFLMGAAPRSMMGWIRLQSDTATAKVPFAYGTCGAGQDGNTFGVYVNASEILTFWGCGSADFGTGVSLSVGRWYHVAVVYDGSVVRVYVNGVLAGSPTSRTLGSGNAGWFVGSDGAIDSAEYAFPGAVDDVRVYNRALSVSEIFKVYTSGRVIQNVSLPGGTTLQNGLVGWWTMDGPDVHWATGLVTDKSAYVNSGYVGGMSTTTSVESGKSGQALLFDGTNDFINVGNSAALHITSSITVSAVIRIDGIAGPMEIISKQGGSLDRGWQLSIDADGMAKFEIADTATTLVSRSTNVSLVPGRWYHVVGVYDASAQTVTTYIDGEVRNGTLSGTVPASQTNSTTNVFIGKKPTNVNYFNGAIDDVRIYARPLSMSEVRQLYDGRR